jgi:putative endonuclease
MSLSAGLSSEKKAQAYLLSQGLTWIESNFRARCGEIDLIMWDVDVLVFVEVRARSSLAFGGGAASVTYQKQQKLMKTASLYMLKHRLHDACVARFDVVSLDGVPPVITWIKDAFNG